MVDGAGLENRKPGSANAEIQGTCVDRGGLHIQYMPRSPEIEVIERLWPDLPEHIRQTIMTLVKA